MGRIIAVVACSLFLLQCTNNRQSYTKVPAPTRDEQLGVLVKASPSEIASLTQAQPQAVIRALNLQRDLFEVSNVDKSIVKAHIADTDLQTNVFIKGVSASKKEFSLKRLAMNTSDDAVAAIETCLVSEKAPEITAMISFNPETITVNLGEEVSFQASATAHPEVGGEVRIFWDMLPPGFSQQGFEKGITNEQTFKPDSTGFYRIGIIAQGVDLSCSFQMIPLMVTANPEPTDAFNLTKVPPLEFFKHISTVRADRAWDKTRGSNITVAVLDTGLNYNHPGIRDNVKKNDAEIADGADNNENGLADDNMGWDFVNADNRPFDDEGHGSHVSGLIASPMAGVAPGAGILPVKVLNAAGSSDLGTVIAGIYYAVDSGAKIINASLAFDGLEEKPEKLVEALEYARQKNVLFMSAAGNGDEEGNGFDIQAKPVYPAALALENNLTVAATAESTITTYSNFSAELVHLAAPGGNENEPVVSLATMNPRNISFAPSMGTSMATPVTAGVAALVFAANPQLRPLDVRNILMETGDELPSLVGKTVSGRQINAEKAVQAALDFKPAVLMN